MIIETEKLSKQYGQTAALNEVSLNIEAGGVVGLLGPNGAGKTTLAEILEGLRSPSSGKVRVLGLNPTLEARHLRERIGVQLQSTAVSDELTPLETLCLFRSFFSRSLPPKEVLTRVGLADKAKARNHTLSGGERQRLAIAMALINDPELVVLDEPTSGLDPEVRREIHRHIADLRTTKRTVLLTTHYIEEAEKLCDRVVILRGGKVVADGSPRDLISKAKGVTTLCISLGGNFDPAPLFRAGAQRLEGNGDYSRYTIGAGGSSILVLGEVLRNPNVKLLDLRTDQPNLESIFLGLMDEAPPDQRLAT
jgi:ABC-2 type transport system ATP-binding protein